MSKYIFVLLMAISHGVSAKDSFFGSLWHTFVLGIPGEIHREGIQLDKKGPLVKVLFTAPKECNYLFNLELLHQKDQLNEYTHLVGTSYSKKSFGTYKVRLRQLTDNNTTKLVLEDTMIVYRAGRSHSRTDANIFRKILAPGKYEVIVEKSTENAKFHNIPAEFVVTTINGKFKC